jgi:hypothetical protein
MMECGSVGYPVDQVADEIAEQKCNVAPTKDTWMKLALQLAIKHKEPGFEMAPTRLGGRTANEKYDEIDQMMSMAIEGNRCSAAEAADTVYKQIEVKARNGGWQYDIPSKATIKTGYSRRRNAEKKLPRNLQKLEFRLEDKQTIFETLDGWWDTSPVARPRFVP